MGRSEPTSSRHKPDLDPEELTHYAERVRREFVRVPDDPILTVADLPFPAKAVLNPGAVEFEGDVLLLLRVVGMDDRSSLYVARSRDGRGDWRIEREPLLAPSEWYDEGGCEDARITYLPDRQEFAILYAGVSHFGAGVCIATTKDFKTVERMGMVIHPYNKDACLFPEKIGGKYMMLHRPTMAQYEDIWVSESDDLIHWGHPKNALQESDRPGWQGGKIGAGPPPFRGDDGWVLIYHGVERSDDKWTYRVGMVVLEFDAPQRIVHHWPEWVFNPERPFEFDEKGQGIVFPSGLVLREGKMLMYYGAGDRCVALATADENALRQLGHEIVRATGD